MNVRIRFTDGHEESFDTVSILFQDPYTLLLDVYSRPVFRSLSGHIQCVIYEYDNQYEVAGR